MILSIAMRIIPPDLGGAAIGLAAIVVGLTLVAVGQWMKGRGM